MGTVYSESINNLKIYCKIEVFKGALIIKFQDLYHSAKSKVHLLYVHKYIGSSIGFALY